jgi:cytosine/adenosine deaminase-related metal-dependent hydrolase
MLLKGGCVITLDEALGTLPIADVLIEGENIAEIAPEIAAADAEVIDAANMLVMPGLVDAHRHTWEGAIKHVAPDADLNAYFGQVLAMFAPVYRPEDVYIGTLIGALEALDAGITTLFDWSHIQHTPEHTDAAVSALQDAGLRAVFGYGFPNTGFEWFYESQLDHPHDARRVRTHYFSSEDQLVTMAMAVRGPELSTIEVTKHDWGLARELGLRMSVHVGNGDFGVPYRAIEQLADADLLGPDTQYVHNVSLTDAAIDLIRETGGTAVSTPAVEMQMGFGMPAAGRFLKRGMRPGLGVDVITSTAGDLFTQIRATFQIERLLASLHPDERPLLTAHDMLEMATVDSARSIWLDHRIGTLAPGKAADVVLLRTDRLHMTPLNDPISAVVTSAYAGDVDTVLVGGRVRKRGGPLIGADLTQVRAKAVESRDYLMQASGYGTTA